MPLKPAFQSFLGGAAQFLRLRSTAPSPRTPENRGRIGALVRGRKAQRRAISTVAASASGRSANNAAISARLLKRCSAVELPAVAVRDQPALGDAQQRVVGLVILAAWRTTARWWRRAAVPGRRRDRSAPARRSARPACRGAAIRHRGGRRTIVAASRSATARAGSGRRRCAVSSGPFGPPVSAIKPAVSPSSQASLTCGRSCSAVSR